MYVVQLFQNVYKHNIEIFFLLSLILFLASYQRHSCNLLAQFPKGVICAQNYCHWVVQKGDAKACRSAGNAVV